jgi:uncharacterized protein (TIGR02265 family)
MESTPASEWFVYEHTVDGLFFKTLAPKITSPLKEKLKALGIDLDAKPKAVLQSNWKIALQLTSESLFAGPVDDRYRQLGHAVLKSYGETTMGKVAITLMRMMGPKRILKRIQSTMRSGNNYITAVLRQLGPASYECVVNECNGNPWYIAGVVEQGLTISGAKNVKVNVFDFDGHGARITMEWNDVT